MREILFRGKRKEDGEWVEGYLVKTRHYPSNDTHYFIIGIDSNWCDYEGYDLEYDVIPETVGQYTNFSDKNGKKIFEGDIIQTLMIEYNPPRQYRKPYQVNYNSDFPSVVVEHYSPFEHFTEKVEYEVIGNIHDNPELIKGGAE